MNLRIAIAAAWGGASNAINMSLFSKLPYDTLRDFEPIALCVEPMGGSPDSFGKFIRAEIDKYAKVITVTGIQRQ